MPKVRIKPHLMKVPGSRRKVRVAGHLRHLSYKKMSSKRR